MVPRSVIFHGRKAAITAAMKAVRRIPAAHHGIHEKMERQMIAKPNAITAMDVQTLTTIDKVPVALYYRLKSESGYTLGDTSR